MNWSWQAQTNNSAHNCENVGRLLEKVRRLRPELWRQNDWLLHRDNAPSYISYFTRESLSKGNMTVLLHSRTYLFPNRRWNWNAAILTQLRWSKQNSRRCWTPSQNMVSRIHLKIGRSSGNGAYVWMGITSRMKLASRPKVNFWPNGSTSARYYGWIFTCCCLLRRMKVNIGL
jgi:hypothetical protein